MNSCPIFYVLALIVCVGGWVALFYYCFSALKGYKGLCPEDVVGKIKRAPKKPKPPPSELDKLLIKPEGVESPVHEICVAILENLDSKRFRFSKGKEIHSTIYSQEELINVHDTHKDVLITFTQRCAQGYYFMRDLIINGCKITLSEQEKKYVDKVWTYVRQSLKDRESRLTKLKEQRHRRAITKLYSEVIPNDQTN